MLEIFENVDMYLYLISSSVFIVVISTYLFSRKNLFNVVLAFINHLLLILLWFQGSSHYNWEHKIPYSDLELVVRIVLTFIIVIIALINAQLTIRSQMAWIKDFGYKQFVILSALIFLFLTFISSLGFPGGWIYPDMGMMFGIMFSMFFSVPILISSTLVQVFPLTIILGMVALVVHFLKSRYKEIILFRRKK